VLLSACVSHPDPAVRRACAYGLWELSVPAALPAARTLLRDADDKVRLEAIAVAFHLPEEKTLAEVMTRRRGAKGEEAERIDELTASLASWTGSSREGLAAGDAAALRSAAAAYWKRRDHFFDPRPGDRALTRAELDAELSRWERSGHVGGDGEALARAILAVSRPDDLAALLRARGQVLLRQSDECLEDARLLERVIRVVQRRALGHPKPNE
jgi:hypothetical protein